MGWIDSIRDVFRRATCLKLVKYDGQNIEFKGLEGEVGGAKFSLGEFKVEPQKVRKASEMAIALDDYQFLACKLSRELPKGDPEEKVFWKVRSAAIALVTMARVTFEAFKVDPKNQSDNLDSLVQRMQHFVDGIVKRASQESIGLAPMPGQGLTGISMDPIKYALDFAGINETELDRMIASL